MTIQTIIDEIQAESVIDLADATLLNHFKSGLRYIASLIKDRVFFTEGTLSMSANDQTKALSGLSAAFVKERAVWYVDSDGARVPIVPPPSIEYFHSVYTTSSTGKPSYYRIEGTSIQFERPFDAATTVGIDYQKEISAVALTDTFSGDERMVQAAKYACKAEYYSSYEEDEQKSDKNERKCKEIISQLHGDFEGADMGGYIDENETD